MLSQQEPDPCPICERPNYFPSDHHMVPRCRGGKATATICADCHRTIHALFSNKELEREYNTPEALLAHEKFAGTIAFLRKQDPQRRSRTLRSNEQKRRGRNG